MIPLYEILLLVSSNKSGMPATLYGCPILDGLRRKMFLHSTGLLLFFTLQIGGLILKKYGSPYLLSYVCVPVVLALPTGLLRIPTLSANILIMS